MQVVDNVYKQLQEKQLFLKNLIDTIEQNAIDLTKFQIMDKVCNSSTHAPHTLRCICDPINTHSLTPIDS